MEVETADEKKRVRGASAGKKGAPGGGLEWELERQYDEFEREMLLMAAAPGAGHQKQRRRPFAADLLQNCDLPPPAKLFGPVPTLQRLGNAAGTEQKAEGDGGGGSDSLLRALRLSQSRAREAEEKLAAAGASNGELAALLVRDSVVLSAHRRWVMILEAENSVLRGGAVSSAVEEEDGAGDARHGVAACVRLPSQAHTVTEVSACDYAACSSRNSLSNDNSGLTTLTLTAGMHYYICTVGSHCSSGMKLSVTAAGSSSGTPPPNIPNGASVGLQAGPVLAAAAGRPPQGRPVLIHRARVEAMQDGSFLEVHHCCTFLSSDGRHAS